MCKGVNSGSAFVSDQKSWNYPPNEALGRIWLISLFISLIMWNIQTICLLIILVCVTTSHQLPTTEDYEGKYNLKALTSRFCVF